MKNQELFKLALGLEDPWQIAQIEFTGEEKRLHLTLDFPEGSQFPCPECGKLCGVHDTKKRTWRHLNFFQYETYLHARQPRVKCSDHKVKTVNLPWSRSGAGFTLLFEALVMALAENGMTPNAIARVVGEHDTLIWRIVTHYVIDARKREDFSEIKAVGMDETSKAKGHNYVSVFMDLDDRRVMFATDGKDAKTVEAFKEDFEAHHGEADQIEEFCLDMSKAFQSGIEANFPEAHLTFDEYHLMKIINKAVDDVRKEETILYPDLLKGTKYLWLTNEWNLTKKQEKKQDEIFQDLRGSKLKTIKAYHLRSVFQDVFSFEDPAEGEWLLKRWYYWATHSRIDPMIRAAKTIKKHWEGVLRWFTSRINNGLLEGMNSLIQAAKARARGYRNVNNLITTIYLIGAKLEFLLPEVLPATHTK